MVAYFEILNDNILKGLHGDSDLILALLLWDEESVKGEFLIGFKFLLSRLEAKHISVLLGDCNTVGDFSLGLVGDTVLLLGAYACEGGSKEEFAIILKS